MQIQFGAKFLKKPSQIEAVQQENPFTLPAPWNPSESLDGKAGDYKVKNLTTNEVYPLGPEVLAQKYDHVAGDTYKTKPGTVVEGRLPLPGEKTLDTREGPAPAYDKNGIPAVILDDAGGTFPLAGKNFLKFYEAVDEDARQIVAHLKSLLG